MKEIKKMTEITENEGIKYIVPAHREPITVPPIKYDELVRQSERLGMIERLIDDAEVKGLGMLDVSTLKLIMGVYPKKSLKEDGAEEEVGEDA